VWLASTTCLVVYPSGVIDWIRDYYLQEWYISIVPETFACYSEHRLAPITNTESLILLSIPISTARLAILTT
jgi:hypothetical protein